MANKYSSITPGNSGRANPSRPGRAPRMAENKPWYKRIAGGAFGKPTKGKWLILAGIAVVALLLVLLAIFTTRGDASAATLATNSVDVVHTAALRIGVGGVGVR